jgi:hypothetical protein
MPVGGFLSESNFWPYHGRFSLMDLGKQGPAAPGVSNGFAAGDRAEDRNK